jgi:molecular chaperone DnaK
MLKDQAASFNGDQKSKVEADLSSLKEALGGSDLEAIKSATERLAVGVQELGKQLYEQAAAAGSGSAGSPGTAPGDGTASSTPADDEVVDAEIVDEGNAS